MNEGYYVMLSKLLLGTNSLLLCFAVNYQYDVNRNRFYLKKITSYVTPKPDVNKRLEEVKLYFRPEISFIYFVEENARIGSVFNPNAEY